MAGLSGTADSVAQPVEPTITPVARTITPVEPTITPVEPTITLSASATHPISDQRVILDGTVSGAPGGSSVTVYANPYPFHTVAVAGTATTAPDGSFSLAVHPDRVTRYGAVVTGTRAYAVTLVYPRGRTLTDVRALPLGQARVSVVVFHPRDLRWNGARVRWWFGSGSQGRLSAAPSTRTRRLSPYATLLDATATLPAGHFRWRACFVAPEDRALVNPRRPPGCPGLGYYGAGALPNGFPGPAAISAAERFLAGRAGRASVGVLDSEGRQSGVNLHERFPAASVIKSMLLVAYLRRLSALGHHSVDAYSNSFLYPMIHVSDNTAATQCWSIVGDSGLYAVAHAAGMTDFSVSGFWLTALISTGDMTRFFFQMDSLIPREFVGYAHALLSTIDSSQSWGVPAVARPLGYEVFFKGGWLPNEGVINQVARLQGHGRTFTIAVLTSGPPGLSYGIGTIQGVTADLLH